MGEDVLVVVVAGIISLEDWSNSFHPIIELQYVRPDTDNEFEYFLTLEAINHSIIILITLNDRAVKSYVDTIVRELFDFPRVVFWRQHSRSLAVDVASISVYHSAAGRLRRIGRNIRVYFHTRGRRFEAGGFASCSGRVSALIGGGACI